MKFEKWNLSQEYYVMKILLDNKFEIILLYIINMNNDYEDQYVFINTILRKCLK